MFPTDPPRYPQNFPPKFQLPMEFQKRVLPPQEYDHDYDGELTILRTLEPVVYRACGSKRLKFGARANCVIPRSISLALCTPSEVTFIPNPSDAVSAARRKPA